METLPNEQWKEDIMPILAHELRSPLAAIYYSIQLMRTSGTLDKKVEEHMDGMERQVQHMIRVIDQIFDLSRAGRGKLALNKELLDLEEVVAQVVETSRPALAERRQELDVSLTPGPLEVEADATRLRQILDNLLHNASKSTGAGGRIGLNVEAARNEVVLRVSDTGVGIDAGQLPHLFEPYVQGDGSAKGRGLGVGLALVKHLVQLHGGKVEAHSAGPGRGSEFVVRLPRPQRSGAQPVSYTV
jgi:signal transduction histidine kinase